MKKILLAVIPLCALGFSSSAQQVKKCGNDEAMLLFQQNHPQAYERALQREALAQQDSPSQFHDHSKTTATVKIPVVFHLALTQAQFNRIGGVAGIEQRVDSQMAVLKRDFQAQNPDLANVPAVFNGVKGNAEIEFVLAHTAPNGQGTPGYEYKIISGDTIFDVSSGSHGSTVFVSDVKYNTKGFAAWDHTKYLNIWICEIYGGSVLGICTKPSLTGSQLGDIPPNERGVVLTYGAFGKRRQIGDFYISGNDRGRTLVHELGHYFELNHIWGNGQPMSCNDDDGISDTPQQLDMNFGCPSIGTVYPNCTNSAGGEMWMNYMDYVSDACMYMFSAGQVNRMKNQFDNNTKPSWSLTQNPHLGNWPASVADIANEVQLSISPNPSNGQFLLTYNPAKGKLQHITITNMVGQQVYQLPVSNNSGSLHISLPQLPSGLYQVQSTFSEGQSTKKLLLQ